VKNLVVWVPCEIFNLELVIVIDHDDSIYRRSPWRSCEPTGYMRRNQEMDQLRNLTTPDFVSPKPGALAVGVRPRVGDSLSACSHFLYDFSSDERQLSWLSRMDTLPTVYMMTVSPWRVCHLFCKLQYPAELILLIQSLPVWLRADMRADEELSLNFLSRYWCCQA